METKKDDIEHIGTIHGLDGLDKFCDAVRNGTPVDDKRSTGPDYECVVTTRTVLTSSQALTALWALRHYRMHVNANVDWPEEKQREVLSGIEETIREIEHGNRT